MKAFARFGSSNLVTSKFVLDSEYTKPGVHIDCDIQDIANQNAAAEFILGCNAFRS